MIYSYEQFIAMIEWIQDCNRFERDEANLRAREKRQAAKLANAYA